MNKGFDKTFALEVAERVLASWWTLVVGVCLGTVAAIAAVHFLPKVYEAGTKIFVTPQRIPQDYVKSTVVDDLSLRVAAIDENVRSRPYLQKVVEACFAPAPTDEVSLERLIDDVRGHMDVRNNRGVIFISYRDRDPVRAARIVNMLADMYISENAKYRVNRAGETTKTLQEFSDRVRGDLETQEKKIAEFKALHLYETTDRQQVNLSLLQTRQRELEAKEKALAIAKDRLRALDEWDAQVGGMQPTAKDEKGATESPRVAELKREIDALRIKYSDDHPEVKAKLRELAEAQAEKEKTAAATVHLDEADIALGRIDDAPGEQRNATVNEIKVQEMEVGKLREEVAEYKRRIENTPIVEQQLAQLTKGLDVLTNEYKSLQSKVEGAKSSQEVEENRQGEQFETIERAVPPALPVFPSPPLMLVLGIVVGLAAFVGPIVAREVMMPHVNSEASLRSLTDIPVFGTIPRLPVPDVVEEDRRLRMRNWGFSALSAIVLLVTLVFLR